MCSYNLKGLMTWGEEIGEIIFISSVPAGPEVAH